MEELLECVRKSTYEKQYAFCDTLYGILVKRKKIPKGSLMLLLVYADKPSIIEAMKRLGMDMPASIEAHESRQE